MLQFNLFGFPIRIHPWFWLSAALLGGALYARSPLEIQGVLVWVAMVFLSILVHELGHAFMMRRFGDRRVEIVLYAFGGMAMGSAWRGRTQQILISVAGPAVQMALGLVVWLVTRQMAIDSALVRYGISSLVLISFFWGALNLLPVIPLDGGRIFEAFVGAGRENLALKVSMVCAVAVAAYLFMAMGALFAAVFFGMLAYNNWQRMNRREETPWMNFR